MALVMTADEALDPVGIRTCRARTGAFEATCPVTRSKSFGLWAIGAVPYNSALISYTIQGKGRPEYQRYFEVIARGIDRANFVK